MKGYSKYLLVTIYICIISVMVLCVLLVIGGIKSFLNEQPKLEYTPDEVFDSELLPVIKNEDDIIVKPYVSDKVKIGSYFYDYKSDNKKQMESIIFYENTYIQNEGTDYISDEVFDVVSSLDGEVESIVDDPVYGKVLTIKHDNFKTIYYNISNILVAVGYKTVVGEIIGTSSPSKINYKNKSLLHFEVVKDNYKIDPENIYNKKISEIE